MKNGVNWIENVDENLYKMEKIDAKSLKLIKLDQLYVHISLELNVIDTNWFFSAERGCQLHYTIGTKSERQSQKRGSSPWKFHFSKNMCLLWANKMYIDQLGMS